MGQPQLSIVLVSDYAAGDETSWASLRGTLTAIAQQDYAGTAEFLLVEHEEIAAHVPADTARILPGLRIVKSSATDSYGLKNHGVQVAQADIVVLLDTDCRPAPDWLDRIAAAWREHPEAAVISGRTNYEGAGTMDRLSALMSRAYADRGSAGPTPMIANNNCSFRRSVYLAHPLPAHLGAFAGRIQSEAILRAGGRLLFEPSIRVIHEFEGWPMEADIRRNVGYSTVITRLRDPQMPYAGLIRMGRIAIPLIVAGKMWNIWVDSLRCWRHFRVRFYELPVAMVFGAILVLMEVAGMWMAFGNQEITVTEYR
jgi:glycosyl transferase family 2